MLHHLVIIIRKNEVKTAIMVVEEGDNEDFVPMMKELMRTSTKIKKRPGC